MLLLLLRVEEGDRRKENGGEVSEELKQQAMGEGKKEEACSTELLGVILTGEAIEGQRGGKFLENHTAVANRCKEAEKQMHQQDVGKDKQGGLTGRRIEKKN
ncbi:hypothetical protein ASPBRDRAFT_675631 [Aspergillus brasiliensis CBS 101740]|uniref:Uncharacterized protein n=1 Tax=Aspergillus brasiliensis (strain CBS 101740 / IMI 381727 / IBT 21946) TaxID=767769 RepID=A0A1L9UGU4_ASPBC|nr:hypothetical protein ASPBRDRAFT_675631 [Aspergillus brasiliensis CBS 101740]